MRENIGKVAERGERLDTLQDKTNNLADSAQGFRRGANRVRKQMWWKDMKMRMCIIVGIIVLLLIIIIPSGKSTTHKLFGLGRNTSADECTQSLRPRSNLPGFTLACNLSHEGYSSHNDIELFAGDDHML